MEPSLKNLHLPLLSSPANWWARIRQVLTGVTVRRAPRQLRLCETISLGEKRLLAVVQYEGQKFLIGGSAHSVNLLTRLGGSADFSEMLTEWCERQR
jgi:flagellar biogenesis protein FliO